MTIRRRLRSLRFFLAPGVRRENFVVLAIHVPFGVSPAAGESVRDALDSSHPEGWWFLDPGSFVVYFLSDREGAARAARCRASVEQLRTQHDALQELQIGEAEGPSIAQFSRRGRMTSMPMGAAANEAIRRMRA